MVSKGHVSVMTRSSRLSGTKKGSAGETQQAYEGCRGEDRGGVAGSGLEQDWTWREPRSPVKTRRVTH